MKTTKLLLDYIVASATSHSEEDQSYLMKLMTPSADRDEMGEVYNNLLGYNPITYFDEQDLSRAYATIVTSDSFQKAPSNVKEFLSSEENKKMIIERALAWVDAEKEEYLVDMLIGAIQEEIGWEYEPTKYDDESFDTDETDDDSELLDGDNICEEDDEDDEIEDEE
jgi:hypothetical protein